MKSFKILLFLLCFFGTIFAQDLSVKDLTCEHKKNPVGIDISPTQISWKITGPGNNIIQSAYSIRVATNEKFSSSETVWQSGKIESDESILQHIKVRI